MWRAIVCVMALVEAAVVECASLARTAGDWLVVSLTALMEILIGVALYYHGRSDGRDSNNGDWREI